MTIADLAKEFSVQPIAIFVAIKLDWPANKKVPYRINSKLPADLVMRLRLNHKIDSYPTF